MNKPAKKYHDNQTVYLSVMTTAPVTIKPGETFWNGYSWMYRFIELAGAYREECIRTERVVKIDKEAASKIWDAAISYYKDQDHIYGGARPEYPDFETYYEQLIGTDGK